MDEAEWTFLLTSYGWGDDAMKRLVHRGENDTYYVSTQGTAYALRRYRQGRHSFPQVVAETAWVERLHGAIPLPCLVKNKLGYPVTRHSTPFGEALYVVFEWISGQAIEHPEAIHYEQLGQLMRRLHEAARQIANSMPLDWPGRNRPEYHLTRTVEDPLRELLAFGALDKRDQERCMRVAQKLSERLGVLASNRHFIHADLHFGNVVFTPSGWFCLDFDECGFGHQALDLGVTRLHLLASGQLDKLWRHFIQGYGAHYSHEEIRTATALRIFYMAGKIPLRQDIEDLRIRPADRIRRYLGYVESEIQLYM